MIAKTVQAALRDAEARIRVLTSLMRDEEVLKMAEQLMEAMEQDFCWTRPFCAASVKRGASKGKPKD